jgi:hypothetical protein
MATDYTYNVIASIIIIIIIIIIINVKILINIWAIGEEL